MLHQLHYPEEELHLHIFLLMKYLQLIEQRPL